MHWSYSKQLCRYDFYQIDNSQFILSVSTSSSALACIQLKQFPSQCINTFDCLSKFPTGFSQQQQDQQRVKHIKSTLAHRASYAFDCEWVNK